MHLAALDSLMNREMRFIVKDEKQAEFVGEGSARFIRVWIDVLVNIVG